MPNFLGGGGIMLKRFGWTIPVAALAIGTTVLASGSFGNVTSSNLPTPEPVAIRSNVDLSGSEAVTGQNWTPTLVKGNRDVSNVFPDLTKATDATNGGQ